MAKSEKRRIPKQRRITSKNVDQQAPASLVINKFGGLTRFCEIFGWPTSTVHGWMVRGLVPSIRFETIMSKSDQANEPIKATDFVPKPKPKLDAAPAAELTHG